MCCTHLYYITGTLLKVCSCYPHKETILLNLQKESKLSWKKLVLVMIFASTISKLRVRNMVLQLMMSWWRWSLNPWRNSACLRETQKQTRCVWHYPFHSEIPLTDMILNLTINSQHSQYNCVFSTILTKVCLRLKKTWTPWKYRLHPFAITT